MVTHIVLWNLKDKTQKAQQGGEMKRRLEALEAEMEQCGSDHVKLAQLYEEKEALEETLLEQYEQQEQLETAEE